MGLGEGEGQWSLIVRGLGRGATGAVHVDGGGAVRVGEGGGDVAVESGDAVWWRRGDGAFRHLQRPYRSV